MPGFNQINCDIENINKAARCIKDDRLLTALGWYLDKKEHKTRMKGLPIPKEIFQLSQLVFEIQSEYMKTEFKMNADALLKQYYHWDVFRRQERFFSACQVVSAVLGDQETFDQIMEQSKVILSVKLDSSWMKKAKGEQIRQALFEKRNQALKKLIKK